ncbi:MAG: hypothetical protein ACQEQ0_08710 [Bacteroidota bacterium]
MKKKIIGTWLCKCTGKTTISNVEQTQNIVLQEEGNGIFRVSGVYWLEADNIDMLYENWVKRWKVERLNESGGSTGAVEVINQNTFNNSVIENHEVNNDLRTFIENFESYSTVFETLETKKAEFGNIGLTELELAFMEKYEFMLDKIRDELRDIKSLSGSLKNDTEQIKTYTRDKVLPELTGQQIESIISNFNVSLKYKSLCGYDWHYLEGGVNLVNPIDSPYSAYNSGHTLTVPQTQLHEGKYFYFGGFIKSLFSKVGFLEIGGEKYGLLDYYDWKKMEDDPGFVDFVFGMKSPTPLPGFDLHGTIYGGAKKLYYDGAMYEISNIILNDLNEDDGFQTMISDYYLTPVLLKKLTWI